MNHDRIYLDETDDRVYIDCYVANDRSYKRDALIVIPGGGYQCVCTDREGEPIALAFVAEGCNAFVLNYRVGKKGDLYPCQLIDASRAILYVKKHAEELCIDPERVFTLGFSAGGHLAGSTAILHSDPEVLSRLGIEKGENKPAGAILCYPVVTARLASHQPSFENLLGKPFTEITDEEKERLSLETNVGADSSPVFIWHTSEDTAVPPIGSLALAESYWRQGIPVMLQIYPYGPHGLALANRITECANPSYVQPLAQGWVASASEWMKTVK